VDLCVGDLEVGVDLGVEDSRRRTPVGGRRGLGSLESDVEAE